MSTIEDVLAGAVGDGVAAGMAAAWTGSDGVARSAAAGNLAVDDATAEVRASKGGPAS